MTRRYAILSAGIASVAVLGAVALAVSTAAAPEASSLARGFSPHEVRNLHHALREIARGRETFRFDTFGNEVFWGETLRLHEAIAGQANGGSRSRCKPRDSARGGTEGGRRGAAADAA